MAVASATTAAPAVSRLSSEFGRQIFLYQKLDTKQTVYSLTRSLQNKSALKQLTYVGKKTVPPALRKDMWAPVCVISFPNTLQGHSAYKALIEFKHRHEFEWPEEVMQDPKKAPGVRVQKKEKMRILQDQKANSIADIAHVLAMQGRPPTEQELKHARYMVHAEGVKRRPRGAPVSKHKPGKKHTAEVLEFRGKLEGVNVWWTNPADAEFAATWPAEVTHGPLAVSRYTAIWPPPAAILTGGQAGTVTGKPPGTSEPSGQEQPSRWSSWLSRKKPEATTTAEPVVG